MQEEVHVEVLDMQLDPPRHCKLGVEHLEGVQGCQNMKILMVLLAVKKNNKKLDLKKIEMILRMINMGHKN